LALAKIKIEKYKLIIYHNIRYSKTVLKMDSTVPIDPIVLSGAKHVHACLDAKGVANGWGLLPVDTSDINRYFGTATIDQVYALYGAYEQYKNVLVDDCPCNHCVTHNTLRFQV
jgi:hypothetical protein